MCKNSKLSRSNKYLLQLYIVCDIYGSNKYPAFEPFDCDVQASVNFEQYHVKIHFELNKNYF